MVFKIRTYRNSSTSLLLVLWLLLQQSCQSDGKSLWNDTTQDGNQNQTVSN